MGFISGAVLCWQFFIVLSMYLAKSHKQSTLNLVALGWGAWTAFMVFYPPLMIFQGIIVFAAWALMSNRDAGTEPTQAHGCRLGHVLDGGRWYCAVHGANGRVGDTSCEGSGAHPASSSPGAVNPPAVRRTSARVTDEGEIWWCLGCDMPNNRSRKICRSCDRRRDY